MGALVSSCLGCQLGYYLNNAYHQSKLVAERKPIENVLRHSHLTDEQKHKLRLVEEAKDFAENELGLAHSSNYTTFVQLDSPYVTYIVQASKAYELEPYLWKFPFVGEVPYKGFFSKNLADEEAAQFDKKEWDTYVRGVSAYSTLGWFQDSVLSSMLRYEDHDLVETIIHETIHTTLFIKSAAEFNERMATFLGHEGMRLFYLKKEGAASPNLKKANDDAADQKLFSAFLTKEVKSLTDWYKSKKGGVTPEMKKERLREIQARFKTEVKPHMKTSNYDDFGKRELNNAFILAYRTYEYSLDDFEKLFKHFAGDFKKTMDWLKTLKNSRAPEKDLKDFVK